MNISVFRAIRTLLSSTLILGLFVVFGLVSATNVDAAEGINERINFQGRLLTHEGATVPDGFYNVQFKIYQDGDGQSANNSTGSPAGTLEWTEEWLNDNSQGVKVRNGYFSVELGSVTAFGSSVDWNQDTLWLSINVGDTVTTCTPFSNCNGDGEMLPMKRLSATPYALNAGKLGGRTADGFIQNNAGTPQAANISIQSADAGDIAAVIQGAAGQTADIFQVKADSVATPLLAVSNIGSVTITPTADTSPALTVNSTTGTIFSASATAIALNQDTAIASGKTLTVSGDTATNIAGYSGASEGAITYDTDNSQLLVYSNGKWKADSTDAILVAASNSSQADKNAADYVADGNTGAAADGDQVQINQALSTAAGKKVVLLAGTYTVDASISIPNNTTLSGIGTGTIVTIPDSFNAAINVITNTDTSTGTGVAVRDLQLDGNRANNTAGLQNGVILDGMGDSATSRQGGIVQNVRANNFRNVGIGLWSSDGNVVSGNIAKNSYYGIDVESSYNDTITGNTTDAGTWGINIFDGGNHTVSGNTTTGANSGIRLNWTSKVTVTGNVANANTGAGINVYNSTDNMVSSNSVSDNLWAGIDFSWTNDSFVVANKIMNNGDTTTNNGIYLYASDNNTITSNVITDTQCDTTCYAIDINNSNVDNAYLADNIFYDTDGDDSSSINDAGTGTVYSNQPLAENGGSITNRTANSTTAFQIQDAAGTSMLTVDTQNSRVVVGSSSTLTVSGNTAFQKGTDFSTTGTSDDVAFGDGTLFRLTGASAQTITGIAGGVDGRMITLVNAGTNSATIANNSGSSIAANRIITGTGGDLTLTIGSGINLIYDSGASLWRVVGSAGGAAITLQDAYDNSGTTDPQIQLDGTNGGIKIQDASSTVGNILQVQDSTGSSTYFAVTANGTLTDALDATATTSLSIGAANATNIIIGKADGTSGISLSSSTITLGDGVDDTTVIGAAQTATDTNGNQLIIQGSTGNGIGDGGVVTVQGGTGGATGANGGNLNLLGGVATGSGATGLVVFNTPTFQTAINDANCFTGGSLVSSSCTISLTSVNGSAAILVGFDTGSQTATLPDPTITTAGRIIYVTAANGSDDFTLSVNGGGTGNQIAMRQNTTATMIWNGSDWTAAGASSSTTLQSAYDNTLQSAGGAELVVSSSGNTNGLTIRDSSISPVNGRILTVQTSSAADLISVNSNVTEYASDAGAEVAGATDTAFPANTWSSISGATVSRYITAGDYIATGQGSVSVVTDTSAGSGVKNQLTTTLTAKTTYNVSFASRLNSSSNSFTDLEVYYSADGSTATALCEENKIVPTSVWSKVNCTFTAPDSGISSSNAIFIRQAGSGTSRTMYIDNLSVTIAADYNYATDGSVNDNTNFTTNWTSVGGATVTRDTTTGHDASDSAEAITTGAGQGVRNKLSINPLTDTLYRITVYAKLDSGTFDNFTIRYSRDGGSNFAPCADYNTQTVATGSSYTKVTCYVRTDSTAATDSYVYFTQTDGTSRTFYVDAFSMSLSTITTPNVQIGGGINGGPTTLFTLDRGASAPIASDNDALLGSMYYDTTLGKLQCYEADGWGACGSSPDNIITISPEYTNAVLHGPSGGATGVGTMTSDICSDALNINDADDTSGDEVCGTNETYNFYKWTSPQATNQTYAIYVTYQLPETFKQFASGQTSIMGRTDVGPSSGTASVSYKVYRNNSSTGLTQCGSSAVSVSSGAVSSWQIGIATGAQDPSTCGFIAGDSIVFEIDMSAYQNANAYVGNLNFTFSNR